jgi:lipopolysaccharide transport system ATP-binding protein
MYVRLAFAVAAHLEPEILIVDEVLAVGDAEFQKKCLGKVNEISRRDGRTVLLVSHDTGVILTLCPSVIWLHNGSICDRGESRNVVGQYLAQRTRSQDRTLALESFDRFDNVDTQLRLKSLEWLCELPLRHGEPVKARIHFNTRAPVKDVVVGMGFSAIEGARLLTYDSDFGGGYRPSFNEPGLHSVEIEIDSLPLAPDIYSLSIGARSGDLGFLDYISARILLDVVPGRDTPGHIVRKSAGVRLGSRWTWKRKENPSERALKVVDQGR